MTCVSIKSHQRFPNVQLLNLLLFLLPFPLQAKKLFSQPIEIKQLAPHPVEASHQRGSYMIAIMIVVQLTTDSAPNRILGSW